MSSTTISGPASGTRSRANSFNKAPAVPVTTSESAAASTSSATAKTTVDYTSTADDSLAMSLGSDGDASMLSKPTGVKPEPVGETGHLLPAVAYGASGATPAKAETSTSASLCSHPQHTVVRSQPSAASESQPMPPSPMASAIQIQPPISGERPTTVQYKDDISLIETREPCLSRCYSPAVPIRHALTEPSQSDLSQLSICQKPVSGLVSPIQMPMFSGGAQEDVHVFTQQFTAAAEMCRWDEQTSKTRLQFALQGIAARFYQSKASRYQKRDFAVSTILKELEENFHSAQSQFVARAQLHQRSQQPFEPVESFAYSIRELALRADPLASDEMLGQTLLNGLAAQIQSAVFLQLQMRSTSGSANCFTFQEVLNSARIVEASLSLQANRAPQQTVYAGVNQVSDQSYMYAPNNIAISAISSNYGVDPRMTQQHQETSPHPGLLAQFTSLRNELKDELKDISRVMIQNITATMNDTRAESQNDFRRDPQFQGGAPQNQNYQRNSYDNRQRGPYQQNRPMIDYSQKPRTPCPLCRSATDYHWKFQCPLILQAKGLGEQQKASMPAPTSQSSNNTALPSKNGQSQ